MLHEKQQCLIEAALRTAEKHGLALGGTAALIACGFPGFDARKIDLVTTRDQVRDAARDVKKELRRSGYQPQRTDTTAERRGRMYPASAGMLAQWEVFTGGKHDHPPIGGLTKYTCPRCWEHQYLELSRAPRTREPVQTALGPVLHPEDAAGAKVREMAARGLNIDYHDVGRLLEHWSPAQLTAFARRQDPRLDPRDLERVAARVAARSSLSRSWAVPDPPEQLTRLREQFANWTRDPRDAARPEPARRREHLTPDREARYLPTEKRITSIRRLDGAERGQPQRQQPVPAIQPRAEAARQALPPQREPRKAEHTEPERER